MEQLHITTSNRRLGLNYNNFFRFWKPSTGSNLYGIFSENIKIIKVYHCGIQVEGPIWPSGTHPFTPNSGFTPGTLVFTHFTSAKQRYAPMTCHEKQKIKLKGKLRWVFKKKIYGIKVEIFFVCDSYLKGEKRKIQLLIISPTKELVL